MQLDEKKLPLVSVIMGTHNGEKYISRCIDSILSQTYQNWEFIICDDCSSDDTYSIIKRYSEQDARIKCIKNEKNQGLAFSLNECLKTSNGTYIARMDDDDISLPERFKIQVDFLNNHMEYALVSSNIVVFDEQTDYGIRTFEELPDLNYLIGHNPFCHPAIMCRKTTFDILNGYNPNCKRAQDYELWFRFFYKGFKGYNIQTPLLKYHESIEDYKKRTLKKALNAFRIGWLGCNLNRVPLYKRVPIFRGIVSAMVPNIFIDFYHKKLLQEKK